MYTTMFLQEVSYGYQGYIYLIKNTMKTAIIVKYYYHFSCLFEIFFIYSCDFKAEFSASLLQSSVSHDPSEIILICWFAAQ